MIYLDHAASTPMVDNAFEALTESLRRDFANPSAAHKLGKDLNKKIERCRTDILKALGAAKNDQLIFTASATESNNSIIKGVPLEAGDEVIFSRADHPSLTVPIQQLERRGIKLIEFPLECGEIDLVGFENCLTDKTKLVVIAHISNQTGNIQPVENIAKIIKNKSKGIHLHVDAVQAFTKIELNVVDSLIDSLSLSGHKIGGPKGIGALYIKNGVQFTPLLSGGGHEHNLRSSTPATPLIISFTEAIKCQLKSRASNFDQLSALKEDLVSKLEKDQIFAPFEKKQTSPYICTLLVPGFSSDILMRHLEMKKIFISSSSACSSKIKQDNPVFEALGINKEDQKSVLRISFSSNTTASELEEFRVELLKIIETLNKLKR